MKINPELVKFKDRLQNVSSLEIIIQELTMLRFFYLKHTLGDPLKLSTDLNIALDFTKHTRHMLAETSSMKELVAGSYDAMVIDTIRDTFIYIEEYFGKGEMTLKKLLLDGSAFLLGRAEDYAFVKGTKGTEQKRLEEFKYQLYDDLWKVISSNNNYQTITFDETLALNELVLQLINSLDGLEPQQQAVGFIRIYGMLTSLYLLNIISKINKVLASH